MSKFNEIIENKENFRFPLFFITANEEIWGKTNLTIFDF